MKGKQGRISRQVQCEGGCRLNVALDRVKKENGALRQVERLERRIRDISTDCSYRLVMPEAITFQQQPTSLVLSTLLRKAVSSWPFYRSLVLSQIILSFLLERRDK